MYRPMYHSNDIKVNIVLLLQNKPITPRPVVGSGTLLSCFLIIRMYLTYSFNLTKSPVFA